MFQEARLPPKKQRPPKAAPDMTLPGRNPLDEQVRKKELTGDTEHDDALESAAALNLLRRVDREAERVMGNGYWTALVFPDEATCQAFMKAAGWEELSEGLGAYVDGLAVAERMGIKLDVPPIRFKSRRQDRRLVEEVGVYDPSSGE